MYLVYLLSSLLLFALDEPCTSCFSEKSPCAGELEQNPLQWVARWSPQQSCQSKASSPPSGHTPHGAPACGKHSWANLLHLLCSTRASYLEIFVFAVLPNWFTISTDTCGGIKCCFILVQVVPRLQESSDVKELSLCLKAGGLETPITSRWVLIVGMKHQSSQFC